LKKIISHGEGPFWKNGVNTATPERNLPSVTSQSKHPLWFGGWVRGNSKRQDLPPAMAHDQQTIEPPERDCRHDERVDCDSAIRMVVNERRPSREGGPLLRAMYLARLVWPMLVRWCKVRALSKAGRCEPAPATAGSLYALDRERNRVHPKNTILS
jgi:hypothetical protein